MSSISLRQKLESGKMCTAAMLRFPDPSAAEIMALSGVDMIFIDNEHYPFDPEMVRTIAGAVQLHGADCLIRLPNAEPARLAEYMDMGLAGIKIPHVETYEQVLEIVSAIKYAPVGGRGFCPITRAASYGYGATPARFAEESNRDTVISLMVETKRGLENIDRILTIPEVDLIAIGPSDVAASFGYPGQSGIPEVDELIRVSEDKVLASGKKLIAQTYTREKALAALRRGVRLMLVGSDLQVLTGGLGKLAAEVREYAR